MGPFYEVRDIPLFVGRICDVPFPQHVHNVTEIVHLMTGEITMKVSGRLIHVHAGDTVVLFPSIVHSYEEIGENASGLCAMFKPDTIAEFADSFRTMRPVDPFFPAALHDEGLLSAIERLNTVAQQQQTHLLTAYLHVYLAHLFSLLPLDERQMDGSLIQQVLLYLSKHFLEGLTLDSVAKELGISRTHLSHIFSSQLEINFRRYINTLRIDYACDLLRTTGMTITEICYACGFNNLRTFHRAFLSERGLQPGEYRDRISSDPMPARTSAILVQ